MTEGEIVRAILPAIVKVGDSGRHDFLGPRASLDEEIAIPLAGDAKGPVCIAQPGHGRIRQPAGKEPETIDELKHEGVRIDHPFLHQDDPVGANIFLQIDVCAGHHQIKGLFFPLIIDDKAMVLQVCPAAFRHFVPGNREFDQAESAQRLVKPVAVKRRKELLVAGQVHGNLVHLRGLIHRTADEKNPFAHSRLSPPFVRTPTGMSPTAT